MAAQKATFETLDADSRTRALTPLESLRLERALRRRSEPKGQKPWTSGDIAKLGRLLVRGKKPAEIQFIMNRTERAIWRKMYLMGWTVRGKGSIAIPPAR
jgi:hypothetical protein